MGPIFFLGLKTVVSIPYITYHIPMKKLLFSLICCLTLPAWGFNGTALERALIKTPVDTPPLAGYSHNLGENARQAIRLGYNSFHTRVNTPQMTPSDINIAIFITSRLKPFLERMNHLPPNKKLSDFQKEFMSLLDQLSDLFLKNQNRYTNALLLDETAATQETFRIVQEALDKGRF